jgi:hypothetical protein
VETQNKQEYDSSWWEHEGRFEITSSPCDYCDLDIQNQLLSDVVDGLQYCEICYQKLVKNKTIIKEVVA